MSHFRFRSVTGCVRINWAGDSKKTEVKDNKGGK